MGRSFQYRSPSSIKRSTGRLVAYLHKMIKITRSMTFKQKEARNMTGDKPETLLDHTNDTSRCSGESSDSSDSCSFITSTPAMSKEICMTCRKECIANQLWKSRLKKKYDDLATKRFRLLNISSVKTWPHSGLQQVAV
jgi:hypothetical protein